MGLLDQILGGLMGGASGGSGGSSPMQNVLMGLLSGQQGGAGQQTMNQNPGMQAGSGMAGGLAGLLSSFQQAGLGHIAQSWVGGGQNQPVSPDQLQSALGNDQVQNMASQAGMQPHDFLSQLSQHLPAAVDGMTPNGRLPDEGSMSV